MARISEPPPKFCTPEWVIANQMKFANAEAERAAAERLIAESFRAIDDTNKTKIMVQQDVNKKLEQRLTDVKFWEKEGDDYLATIKGETGALVELVKRIDKAIDNIREELHIAQQCLVSREKRRGIDLVHDIAEMELLKEVEVCQGVLALLMRGKEEATEQLRLNRQTQYNLEKDLKHKMITIGIDNHCHELSETGHGNQLGEGITYISPSSSSVDDWLNFATDNISAAEKTRQNSVRLRSILDQMMQVAAHDVQRQVDTTNDALDTRIQETRSTKEKLEDHLRHIKHQIVEMEDNIDRLAIAIEEKMPPLRLSHTRLGNRSNRPGIELARDPVQYRLIEEVEINAEMVATLNERLSHSRYSLAGLDRKRLELEEDIAIKTNTLFIDEVECMGMRKSIKVNCY